MSLIQSPHSNLFDPTGEHAQALEDDITIKYIHHLYSIELLRYININNVDLEIAYQYGQEFLEPWRNEKVLVKQFLDQNKHELRKYIIYRAMQTVQTLFDGLDDLCTDVYVPVPIDVNTRVSILNAMDQMSNVTQFKTRLLDEYLLDLHQPNSTIRHAHSNFADFEIADRILCSIFNNFTGNYKDLDTKKNKAHYGAHRKELTDNRFYMCQFLLKKNMDMQCADFKNGMFYDNFGAYACLFSMLYRLFIPCHMHPNQLERMYDKYIIRSHRAEHALSYARSFSNLTVESVLGSKLPPLSKEYEMNTDLPSCYRNVGVYPESLVERYIVTSKLFEKVSN